SGGAFVTIATQNFSGTTYQTFNFTINDNSNDIRIKIVASNPSTYLIVDELTITALSTEPELNVSPASLSGFIYIEGSGPSSEQTYNLSGSFLTGYPGDITANAPTNYEISLSSGSGFASSLNIPYTSATLSTTVIYVRLKAGLSAGTYNSETISHSGGAASTVNVTCSGSVSEIPPPALVVNPSTLNGFTYVIGNGPSAFQSFVLSGTYLTGYPSNITVSAPTNYEISLSSGSGYTTNLNIPYSSATLNSTTIYVRLVAGLVTENYNSETITVNGGGAPEQTVTCNGSVTDVPPAILSINPSILSGFSYTVGSGPSGEQSYNLSGTNLTGYPANIIVTAPTNYEISLSSGNGYTTSLNIPYSSVTLNSTTIFVRLKADLIVGTYNFEFITNSGGGATDVDVTCNGYVLEESEDPCLAEDFSGFTSGTHESPATTDISGSLDTYTQTNGWTGLKIYSAGGEIKLGTASANGYIITPTIDLSDGGSLSFDYSKWASDASVVQVFHASDGVNFVQVGSDITPETDFQNVSLEISEGTASSKIKIGTNVKRAYLDNIEVFCGGSAPTPLLSVTPNSLSGFNYIEGSGPSSEQSFALSGTDMNGTDVTITPSTSYEISLTSGTGFQSTPITLSSFNGNTTTIYIRLKAGLQFGIYNLELITISGGGASEVIVTCNGYVEELLTPELSANPSELSGFDYIEGSGPSSEQSFSLSGTDLNGTDVTITPSTSYEISLTSGTGFQSTPITLSSFNGNTTTIYIRLKAGLQFGIYNLELITISGGGASDITVGCSGYVEELLTPELFVNPATLEGFTYLWGEGPSVEQSFVLSGSNLNDDQLTLTPPANYEISLSQETGYQSDPIIFNSFSGDATTIYVRLKSGLEIGEYNSEMINISGSGASDVTVICNGYVDINENILLFNSSDNCIIYPIPFSDILNISFNELNNNKVFIEIYDVLGKVIYHNTFSIKSERLETAIDLHNLNTGIYFLRYKNGNDTFVKKIEKR
ncbi:MAG TPA: T9SS type A sorting domain-containing protein, partial [Bacteroidales bacterium]|nr:T9SS type A sorting domain-containing protein [Bacteroidales bacterium]